MSGQRALLPSDGPSLSPAEACSYSVTKFILKKNKKLKRGRGSGLPPPKKKPPHTQILNAVLALVHLERQHSNSLNWTFETVPSFIAPPFIVVGKGT